MGDSTSGATPATAPPRRSSRGAHAILTALCGLLLVTLFGHHCRVVSELAVDVPYWDEWSLFTADGLARELTVARALRFHNEHRIAPTRLQIRALYHWNGWDLAFNQRLNLGLFGLLVFALLALTRCWLQPLPSWVACLAMVFLVSPRPWRLHSMGMGSCVHFALLFWAIGAGLLFSDNQSNVRVAIGSLACVIAGYSFGAGQLLALVTLIGFLAFKLEHALLERARRRAHLVPLSLFWLPAMALTLGWFAGFPDTVGHDRTWPHQYLFWAFLSQLIAHGFGFDNISRLTGALCSLLMAVPLGLLVMQRLRRRFSPTAWGVTIANTSVLAVLAGMTFGRAAMRGDGNLWEAKVSRYAEEVSLVVPVTLAAWALVTAGRSRRLQALAIAGVLGVSFVGYSDNWKFRAAYQKVADARRAGLGCVIEYYRHGGTADCPTLFPIPIADRLEEARRLDASFSRAISRPDPRTQERGIAVP